ncbi:hypothetical protein SRIMM317S_04923 [Streptomyces rimosus subsp. rimosus]
MNGDAQLRGAVLRAAAGAAKDTPGVAFLRPGFGELLRGTVAGRASRTGSAAAPRRYGTAASRAYVPSAGPAPASGDSASTWRSGAATAPWT